MASYSDLGSFMPSKSAYVNPGEYEAAQRNIALQKGTYMSEMDARYAQIDEAARQFDLGLGLEQQKFDFTSDLQTKQFLETMREFDINAALKGRELGLTGKQLDLMGEGLSHDEMFDWIGLGIDVFKPGSEGGSIWDSLTDVAGDAWDVATGAWDTVTDWF